MNIRHNAFTENLDSDWVAIDQQGNPVCRAGDEDTVRRAVPHAALYMTSGKTVYADGTVVDTNPKPKAAKSPEPPEPQEPPEPSPPEPKAEKPAAGAKARGRKA